MIPEERVVRAIEDFTDMTVEEILSLRERLDFLEQRVEKLEGSKKTRKYYLASCNEIDYGEYSTLIWEKRCDSLEEAKKVCEEDKGEEIDWRIRYGGGVSSGDLDDTIYKVEIEEE